MEFGLTHILHRSTPLEKAPIRCKRSLGTERSMCCVTECCTPAISIALITTAGGGVIGAKSHTSADDACLSACLFVLLCVCVSSCVCALDCFCSLMTLTKWRVFARELGHLPLHRAPAPPRKSLSRISSSAYLTLTLTSKYQPPPNPNTNSAHNNPTLTAYCSSKNACNSSRSKT